MTQINFVQKGWGYEKWLVNKSEYCGKLLFFAKDKKCSLHYHKLKDETFYVHKGSVQMWYSDDLKKVETVLNAYGLGAAREYVLRSVILKSGDVFPVPRGRVHQVIALEDTEVFEFSTEHFDEDSYRLVKGD
jgi:quercetin dioxygenase-like cupin family protein